jgi:hypothetical protein
VASDPREDSAKENDLCTGKQKRDENKTPNTPMRSVLCPRVERMVSDPRKDEAEEDQICTTVDSRSGLRI